MIRVRLVNAPDKTGTFDEVTTRTDRYGKTKYCIIMDNNNIPTWLRIDEFEKIPSYEDPYSLILKGKYGDIENLRRTLINARIGGNLSDMLYSLEVSNTTFYPYQFKPVLRILESPTKGILIADEVGLGKTIEAGLIWTELQARYGFSKLVVLCPAMLREKWKLELQNKFGIVADILDSESALKKFQAIENGHHQSFCIIGSYEGWRQNEKLLDFLDYERSTSKNFVDFVILDEAHKAKNKNTSNYRLANIITQVADYVALLTATPIMLSQNDLFILLGLIDPATYSNDFFFQSILSINEPLVKLRDILYSDAKQTYQEILYYLELYNSRRLKVFNTHSEQVFTLISYVENLLQNNTEFTFAIRARIGEQLDYCNILSQSYNRTRRREVESENQRIRTPVDQNVQMTIEEEHIYQKVVSIIKHYCNTNNIPNGFLLATPQRQLSSSIPATVRRWIRRAENFAQELERESLAEEQFEDIGADDLTKKDFENLGVIEREIFNAIPIQVLREEYQKYYLHDTKFNLLLSKVKEFLAESPKAKIVLFSFFRDTLEYLHQQFSNNDIHTILLHGGTGSKNDIVQTFEHDSGINILLTSEVGSEGIDLQFSSILINYDLPWNPMRIEQRVGRLDRIGQQSKRIDVWNFISVGTIDERIYHRLLMRINIFKRSLGGLEDFIGSEIRNMTQDLLRGNLTKEEENTLIDRTALAIETKRTQEEKLEEDAINLTATGDYLIQKITNARDLHKWISSEDLLTYFCESLNICFPKSDFFISKDNELRVTIKLDTIACIEFEKYLKKNSLLSFPTQLRRSGNVECLFANKLVYKKNMGIEVINQFHPIIRFIIEKRNQGLPPHSLVAGRMKLKQLMTHSGLEELKPDIYVFLVRGQQLTVTHLTTKIYYRAISYRSDNILDNNLAEALLGVMSKNTITWEVPNRTIDNQVVLQKIYNLLDYSDKEIEEHKTMQQARFTDRMSAQRQSLIEKFNRKRDEINNFINMVEFEQQLALSNSFLTQELKNKIKVLPAKKGQLAKLKEEHEYKIEKINDIQKGFTEINFDICMGILLIEDE